jgi:OmpA-OmpF porin, OOP family
MSKFGKFLVGVCLSTLIAIIAHFVHRNQIAADLTQSAQAELSANYMSWAKISFVGEGLRYRTGVITGTPPDEGTGETAKNLVMAKLHNNSFHLNNMLQGGVHNVILKTGNAALAGPYVWRAEIVGGEVVLRGDVPDDATRQSLLAYAKEQFDGRGFRIVDQMTIKANPPAGDWQGAAKTGIAAIAALGNEFTELNDTALSVVGVAKTDIEKSKIEAAVNALGGGYIPQPAINVVAETVSAAPAAQAPAAQAVVDSCQQDIDAVMTGRTINFDTGRATLKQSPDALLDRLADVAAKCPQTSIQIAGHTDKRGSDAANLALSEARANTVRDYLVGKGIQDSRLSAEGKGETDPVDPADTPEAYEKNRRIEFTVSATN